VRRNRWSRASRRRGTGSDRGRVTLARPALERARALRPATAPARAESFIAWSLAGQVALLAVLWLFYDRYLLALLPLLVALV